MATIRGWKFPIDVDKTTGRFKAVEDNENIKQSINLILQTEKTERKMRPSFGTRVHQFIFNSIDVPLVNRMADEINNSLETWEDHLEELVVNVRQSEQDIGAVEVEINYITDLSPQQERLVRVFDSDYKVG